MMMPFKSFAALAAAGLTWAATPPGFQPGSTSDLVVAYRSGPALSGSVVPQQATHHQPIIATNKPLDGSSYAILMVDMDSSPKSTSATSSKATAATSMLLHWMQAGLIPSKNQAKLNTTKGPITVYPLLANSSTVEPLAQYIAPRPPAKIPLSHRYVEILVDTSAANQSALDGLRTAAQQRRDFDVMKTLETAGLQTKVVAGNYFNVTNPGPANGTSPEPGQGGAGGGGNGTVVGAASSQGTQSFMGLVLFSAALIFLAW